MKPFIKWVGGKGQLIPEIKKRLPKEINCFYEPFVGGGAVLFNIKAKKYIINDINTELIHTYEIVRDNLEILKKRLDILSEEHNSSDNPKEFYLMKRAEYNNLIGSERYSSEFASLFIYLNKTAFNGIYRVNSKGLFNVPFNTKKNVNLYDEENLNQVSKFLKNVAIYNKDFEEVCVNAQKGDFVFFDSPYAPLKSDSFESYTKEGFSKEEHIRLANLFKKLSNRGVNCMITNHNTEFIQELYKEFNQEVVNVKRLVNSVASNRVGTEVIITNYKLRSVNPYE